MPLLGPQLQDIAHLTSNDLLSGLESSELASIAQAGRVRSLRAGAYLFRQGASATNLYILVAGRIKMTQLTPGGHQVLLRVAGPGETLGAIAAIKEARYPATAPAGNTTRVISESFA